MDANTAMTRLAYNAVRSYGLPVLLCNKGKLDMFYLYFDDKYVCLLHTLGRRKIDT